MNTIRLIFSFEYWYNVKQRPFLFFTFFFPFVTVIGFVFMAAAIVTTFTISLLQLETRPVGLIDEIDLITNPNDTLLQIVNIDVKPYASVEDAQQDLEAGVLQTYVRLPEDYWDTGHVEFYQQQRPHSLIQAAFQIEVYNAVQDQLPPDIRRRYLAGADIRSIQIQASSINAVAGSPTETPINMSGWLIMVVVVLMVNTAINFGSVRIYDRIVSEADNRTIEILLSSMSPLHFLTGKVAALSAVSLTQILVWVGLALMILIPIDQGTQTGLPAALLNWSYLPLVVFIFFSSFIGSQLFSAILGLLQTSGGAGAAILGVISFIIQPAIFYAAFITPRLPDNLFSRILTFLPITQPFILPIRLVVTEVPLWEITLALTLTWLSNLGSLWLLKRSLQLNLLRYDQRFALRNWIGQQWKRWRSASKKHA